MNIVHNGNTLLLGLGPDELLLESIQAAIDSEGIQDGVIISGIGTLKTGVFHYITGTGFPAEDRCFNVEGPLELLSLSGIIAAGEPHLHGMVSEKEGAAHGGHIEPGCRVAYLAEIAIQVCSEAKLTRCFDAGAGVALLKEKA